MQKSCSTQFTGNKTYKLDPKGRVTFPSHWQMECGTLFKVLQARRNDFPFLKCYTEEGFDDLVKMARRKGEAANYTEREISFYVEGLLGDCFDVEINTQNKLLIPKEKRDVLKLSDQVVLVGRGCFYEIWQPEDYNTVYEQTRAQRMALDEIFGILS